MILSLTKKKARAPSDLRTAARELEPFYFSFGSDAD
jgi:hypothetical protein